MVRCGGFLFDEFKVILWLKKMMSLENCLVNMVFVYKRLSIEILLIFNCWYV